MAVVVQGLAIGHLCPFPTCQAPWKMPERYWRADIAVGELCRSCRGSAAPWAPMARRRPSWAHVPHRGLTTRP